VLNFSLSRYLVIDVDRRVATAVETTAYDA
jgi:hypothetical protein